MISTARSVAVDATSRLNSGIGRVYSEYTTRRHGLIGLSLLRIGYGVVLLGLLAANFTDRQLLWGPDSLYPYERFSTFARANGSISLYALSDSLLFSELLYFALAAAAVAFTLGWRTRLITPVLWVLVWSWHDRVNFVLDGGDNLMVIVLVYLFFAQTSAYFSLDARRAGRRAEPRTRGTWWQVGTVLHNTAVLAVVFQLCVLYLASGMYKVQGERWYQGTAVYYIMRVAEFSPFPGLSRFVYQNGALVNVVTYMTVFLQVSFPFLLLNTHTRHAAFVMVTGMHLGIGFFMGLPFFSGFMIATDLVLFKDREYVALAHWWRRVRSVPPAGGERQDPHASSVRAPLPPTATADGTPAPVPVSTALNGAQR